MNTFNKLRNLFVLLFCFSLIVPQTAKPLSTMQKSCLVGGAVALMVGIYCFKKNQERYQDDEKEDSTGKNVAVSSAFGLGLGALAGSILYAFLNGKVLSEPKAKEAPAFHLTTPDLKTLDMGKPTPGFYNLGNSCFMNTGLQCELNSPIVRHALRQNCSGLSETNDATALFTQLLYEGLTTAQSVISPDTMHTFIRNKYFKQDSFGAQHDSAEFIQMLINDLEPINNVYTWKESQEVFCSQVGCTYKMKRSECNSWLALPLEHDNLQAMINAHYSDEIVDGWKCDQCKKTGIALKKCDLSTTPKRLLIQLKRFDHDLNKNNNPISFPRKAKLLDNKTEYCLQSFHVHSGATPHGGHYYAYVKHPSKNQWFLYNDSIRTEVSLDDINAILNTGIEPLGGTPYTLCYEIVTKPSANEIV